MLHRSILVLAALAATAAAGACSSSSPQCHVGADCASGACDSGGRCVPVASSSGGDAATPVEAGVEAAAEGGVEAAPAGDAASGCVPNHDGTVTRGELPMLAGVHASYAIAESVTMSTAGTAQPGGAVDWDFSGALSGDHVVTITTDAPAGQWFASKFGTATYTTKLSDTQTLLGVFQATQAALLLQGVVTPTSASPQTAVSYAPAATILAVPMQVATTWTSTSTVSGTL